MYSIGFAKYTSSVRSVQIKSIQKTVWGACIGLAQVSVQSTVLGACTFSPGQCAEHNFGSVQVKFSVHSTRLGAWTECHPRVVLGAIQPAQCGHPHFVQGTFYP